MKLSELKKSGARIVIINGFKETVDYALTLTNLVFVGEAKSDDGYSVIYCYETK